MHSGQRNLDSLC